MSPGASVADYSAACGDVKAKLYGFGINSAKLRKKHIEWLDEFVVPILSEGGSVSLVGEASRSGSTGLNQGLSLRRAESVLDHLRREVRGLVRYSDATLLDVRSLSGVGESAAAKAGLRDGTEDAFYRAVRIRSWSRPVPPSPPEANPSVPKTVKRVISRRWHSVNTRTAGGGNPLHDGGGGALLGDLVNKAIDTAKRGGSDSRSYHDYPPDYVVVRVHEESTLDDSLWTGPVSTTTYDTLIRYEWGVRTPVVTLFKKSTFIMKGGTKRVKSSTETYGRSEIWKHATAPDASVFG